MSAARSGVVHGRVIELDAPVPDLEGRRVMVTVEPLEEAAVEPSELLGAWATWVTDGPEGPIADDGDPELP